MVGIFPWQRQKLQDSSAAKQWPAGPPPSRDQCTPPPQNATRNNAATRRKGGKYVKIAEHWREEENFWPGCLKGVGNMMEYGSEYDGIKHAYQCISVNYICAVVSNMHSSLGPLKSPPADGFCMSKQLEM